MEIKKLLKYFFKRHISEEEAVELKNEIIIEPKLKSEYVIRPRSRPIKREESEHNELIRFVLLKDIAYILDKRLRRSTDKILKKKQILNCITPEEVIDLLENKFDTLPEITQRNIKTYLENNDLIDKIKLNEKQNKSRNQN